MDFSYPRGGYTNNGLSVRFEAAIVEDPDTPILANINQWVMGNAVDDLSRMILPGLNFYRPSGTVTNRDWDGNPPGSQLMTTMPTVATIQARLIS